MSTKSFRELIVWQKSMDLTAEVYHVTESLPKDELYALTNQIRRSAVSIPSNIAEGNQRLSGKEYIHFLSIAKGSLGELETQLMLCERLNYLTKEQMNNALALCIETGKMLNGLINSIKEIEGRRQVP